MIAGEAARLDDVVEHVLAVARAVLEPAEELDDLRRQARDAGVVGRRSPAWRMTRSTSARALATTSSMRPGWIRPSLDELGQRQARDLAADGVEAADEHDGLGRVVDDQVDAGRLLEGADVAALAADDPALHLVADGRWTTRDGVLRGVVGVDALDRGDDRRRAPSPRPPRGPAARSPGRARRRRARPPRGPASSSTPLASSARQPADALEGDDLLLACAWASSSRGLVELALAVDQLAVALLEHVGALVELLVALEQPALEVLTAPGAWRAPRPRPRAARRTFSSLASRIRSFCWRPGSLDDPRGLVLGLLDRLARHHAARKEAEYGSAGEGQHGPTATTSGIHLSSSRPADRGPEVSCRLRRGRRSVRGRAVRRAPGRRSPEAPRGPAARAAFCARSLRPLGTIGSTEPPSPSDYGSSAAGSHSADATSAATRDGDLAGSNPFRASSA